MGKEPSLSIFSGFSPYAEHISNQPRRKLMKPFQESYKQFKDHFFQLLRQRHHRLEGTFFSLHHSSCGGAVVEASPLATAQPVEESTLSPPVVVLDSIEESSMPAAAGGLTSKYAAEEGMLQSQEQPSKRALAVGAKDGGAVDFKFFEFFNVGQGEGDDTWIEVMNPRYPIDEVVDKRLSFFNDLQKAKELRLPKSLEVIQRYVDYSFVLAKTVEKEFKGMAAYQQTLAKKNKKAHDALLKLSAEYANVQVKINSYQDATTNLQTVVETKDLRLAQQDLEHSRDYFNAQTKILEKEKEALTSAKASADEEISRLTAEIEA
ncbi:hypothetical protein CR513_01969, partial [Mucuna pruriens]